jgi:hypothetical protein
MQCYCDYEAAAASPILVTSNQAKADAKVREMTDRQVVRNAAMAAIRSHMESWRASNPRPTILTFTEKALPNYGTKRKGKWSPEQSAEYKSIQDYNQAGWVAAGAPMRDWSHRYLTENERFAATFSQEVQDDIKSIDEKSYWEIEEVPYED